LIYCYVHKRSFQCSSWFNPSYFMSFFHYYTTCFGLTRTIVKCVCCCT
jgi:hypothetical protein